MENNKIYVTTMYRWGDYESHSYVIYVGYDRGAAIAYGKYMKDHRGGKYEPEVVEFIPDDPTSKQIIYKTLDK